MATLSQILAIEKTVKSRVYGEFTKLHHAVQKPSLLNGFHKTYQKKDEDGDDFPDEHNRVQLVGSDVLAQVGEMLTELFDTVATKDWANCEARADVVVDGERLIEQAPATYLLFLEKQLADIQTFMAKIPTLDPAEDWQLDENSQLFRSKPTRTTKTKKVNVPIVLYEATTEHPAQTQLVNEDVVIGSWTTVRLSGAMPDERKKALKRRVEKLIAAVKFAREEANSKTEAAARNIGRVVFDYLLAP